MKGVNTMTKEFNNVVVETQPGKMIITIDTTRNLGPSKSGKTMLVASTQGNKKIDTDNGEITIGVNAYKARKF